MRLTIKNGENLFTLTEDRSSKLKVELERIVGKPLSGKEAQEYVDTHKMVLTESNLGIRIFSDGVEVGRIARLPEKKEEPKIEEQHHCEKLDNDDFSRIVKIYGKWGLEYLQIGEDWASILEPRYCPFCGRKLS